MTKARANYYGVIEEVLADRRFRVRILFNGAEESVLCILAGRLQQFKLSFLPGDKVAVFIGRLGDIGLIDRRC